MELKGKKAVFLGDSITEGVGASSYENCYVETFGRLSGAKVENFGVGGTRIARQTNKTGSAWDEDFIERADKMPSDADLVVVFGGTNDFGHGDSPFGEFGDETEYTFYGALRILCEKLLNKYPEKAIVLMTPLHRPDEDSSVNQIGLPHEPLSAYVRAIKEVAEYYSLPVLDLWANSGIQPKLETLLQIYMPDGIHPSDKGAAKIAEMLYRFVKYSL